MPFFDRDLGRCLIAAVLIAPFLGAEPLPKAEKEETFDAVWEYVNRSYYDETFGGRDWKSIGDAYRSQLDPINDWAGVRSHLTAMLNELGQSHFGIIPRSSSDLAEQKNWVGGWSEMSLCYGADFQILVFEVLEDGAAWNAGLRPGDEILVLGDERVESKQTEARQSGMPDHLVPLSVMREIEGALWGSPGVERMVQVKSPGMEPRVLSVPLAAYQGRMTSRFGNVPEMPLHYEADVSADQIAYLRFSLWFPAVMEDITSFVTGLEDSTRGLIIDLRGNPGGIGMMAGGVTGLISDQQVELGTTHLREGYINFVGFPQRGAFLGKVAVLTDELSASTSEIFAAGLQEAGRVRVFGSSTAGAVLPSVFTRLPNGDLLQSVMGDFKTPKGVHLEGRGAIPDEFIQLEANDLAEGRDSVAESARRWILQSTQVNASGHTQTEMGER